MADKRITELNLHLPLELSDVLPIVNSNETKKSSLGSVNTFVRNQNTPLTASGITVSGDIVPTTPQGSTLGTIDNPFRELFLQSGSISIESDTPGDPSAVISNKNANLEVSIGGMRLVESGSSFISPTGSFDYLSVSGSVELNGSMDISNGDYLINGNSYSSSLMITGSLVGSALRFEKGDSSTFDIELGTDFVQVSYLSCYSTSSQQLIASGAAQAVTFNSIWAENGVHIVSGSQITFDEAAAYEFKFVAKVENSDNAVHDVWFWVKYNGENFPNSATRMTLQPRKSSGESSSQLMTVSITGVAQNDNDYIELYWTGESTTTSLHASPGNGVVPSSPSIIASIIRV